jgi:glycosyltransferase involved in cell wall biosynthesis
MGLEKNRLYRRSLEQSSEISGLSEIVHFGDFAENTREVLAGNLAALNLSQSESFSRTVLEASAAGLPVIASRSGGPEEIIEHNETGYLIPLNDPVSCANAMIALCDNPLKARDMGAAGRRRIIRLFSSDRFRQELMSLFDLKVLDGRSNQNA